MPEMNPLATLEPRDTDVALLPEQLKKIAFFAQLKSVPKLEEFPGTLLLRFFRKGEVICRQGEYGWSAFSILSDQDALEVLREYLTNGAVRAKKERLEKEINRLQGQSPSPDQEAASVFLAIPRPRKASKQGLLERLGGKLFGSPKPSQDRPLYIPIDGPTDIPYDTRQGTLRDGDLFGEMSSLYGTPRSATVVASRDVYVLEMLRNILDRVKKDKGFQDRVDKLYKDRVLQMHLSGLAIFRDLELTEEQLTQLRQNVEIKRFKDGDVICHENDHSDSLYIIRGGLVKVVKNASALLAVEDVRDWGKLASLLREGGQAQATGPRAALWKLLPAGTRDLLAREAATLQRGEQQEVVHGFNELIKSRKEPDLEELRALAAASRPQSKKTAEWPDQELYLFNRQLLQETLPEAIRDTRSGKGPQSVLASLGHGEFFGEMGLLLKQPRSASCVAYVHPLPEGKGPIPVWFKQQGDLVEMVRIPEKTFWMLVEANPALRANVEKELARHQQADVRRRKERTWDEKSQVQSSDRFSKLGLVQGQRLMLIDLDRCTRCDECVQACVHSHSDGRSRLFLDGERFGKYLVPTTCRSCLEPVCMIGCPVGSIHRGANRQIVIEDWCIGCGLCSRNCPYGSIQMHDLGLVPKEARDWLLLPAQAVPDSSWNQPGYADAHWLPGKAPFFNDPDLRALLQSLPSRRQQAPESGPVEEAVYFRREFHLSKETIRHAREFKLEITSTDETATVWVNGQPIQTKEKAKRSVRTFLVAADAKVLRAGRNVVAVRVNVQPGKRVMNQNKEVPLFDMRLDEVRVPDLPAGIVGDYTETSYGELAVVCDLCSEQFGHRPACVTACPHDAAMRVDARFEFPEQ